MKIYFGEHNGKEISEIPTSYLHWLIESCSPQPVPKGTDGSKERARKREMWRDLISEVEDELESREGDDPEDEELNFG